MYYRWGPYFEADCQDPAYVRQLRDTDAYHLRIREEQAQQELQQFWDALQGVPSYSEHYKREKEVRETTLLLASS